MYKALKNVLHIVKPRVCEYKSPISETLYATSHLLRQSTLITYFHTVSLGLILIAGYIFFWRYVHLNIAFVIHTTVTRGVRKWRIVNGSTILTHSELNNHPLPAINPTTNISYERYDIHTLHIFLTLLTERVGYNKSESGLMRSGSRLRKPVVHFHSSGIVSFIVLTLVCYVHQVVTIQ